MEKTKLIIVKKRLILIFKSIFNIQYNQNKIFI